MGFLYHTAQEITMETTTILLVVLVAVVYTNLGWLSKEIAIKNLVLHNILERLRLGPVAWESTRAAETLKAMTEIKENEKTESVAIFFAIVLGPIIFVLHAVCMLIVWTCYFTFGGGLTRFIIWLYKRRGKYVFMS